MAHMPPSIKETAFSCPHCGAFAKQFWFDIHVTSIHKDSTPHIITHANIEEMEYESIEDKEVRARVNAWASRALKGRPFFDGGQGRSEQSVTNMWFSKCYNCNDICLWIYDRLIYPQMGEAPSANPDMPEDIRRDYDEASAILDLSPRGAAALIRLAIQKLCQELGQPGKNINDDIGALVKSGLDRRVQQALDLVRVIGNSAVHPGQIDLRDDRATAETLFKLLNLIVEKTISEPRHVEEMYNALPDNQRNAIEKRDGKSGK